MSRYSRRFFLKFISSLALPACQTLIFDQKPPHQNFNKIICGSKGFLYIHDLPTGLLSEVRVPNDPHSFCADPKSKNIVWVIGKWQRTVVAVDILSKKIILNIESPQDAPFAGHAVFSKNGESIFITANNQKTGHGEVYAFDSATGKKLNLISAGADALHDCQVMNNDELLLTSVGRPNSPLENWQRTSVFFVDPLKQKIVEQQFIAEKDQWITHATVLNHDTYIATSTPYLKLSERTAHHGAVYFGRRGQNLQKVILPQWVEKKIKNEFLSSCVDQKRQKIAITNPRGSVILWLDAQKGSFLNLTEGAANGVTYKQDTDQFIFSPFSGQQLFITDYAHALRPIISHTKTKDYIFDSGHTLFI